MGPFNTFKLNTIELKPIKLKRFNLDKLNQFMNDLPCSNWLIYNRPTNDRSTMKRQTRLQNDVAYFCEHDGIYIHFTRARSTWHALAPSALKPWWLFLKPSRIKTLKKN